MWSFMFIAALLFSLVIALFALDNQQPVTVSYFFGEREVSAVLLILFSACAGALVIALLGTVSRVKTILQLRDLRKRNREQKEQLEQLQEEYQKLLEQLPEACGSNNKNWEKAIEEAAVGEIEELPEEETEERINRKFGEHYEEK